MRYVKKETIDKLIKRQQRTDTYIKARYQGFGFDDKYVAHITTKNKKYLLVNDYSKGYRLLQTYDLAQKKMNKLPKINFIGNKRKIVDWICDNIPKDVNSIFDDFEEELFDGEKK